MAGDRSGTRPRAKRQVRRGRRHGRSGPRKRITVFLSAPLLKKVSRILAAEGQSLEACLEQALEAWLRLRQNAPEDKPGDPTVDTGDRKL
jgi:hypothetical protein